MPPLVPSHLLAFAKAAAAHVELVTDWHQAIASRTRMQHVERFVLSCRSSRDIPCILLTIYRGVTILLLLLLLRSRTKLSTSYPKRVGDVHAAAAAEDGLAFDRHDDGGSCIERL